MIRLFGFLGCLTLFFGCGKETRPDDILSPEEMVTTMTEIYVVEAKVSNIPVNRDSTIKIFEYLEAKTFDQLGVSESVFKKSFDYYLDRPDELEKIYTVIIDSLNLREQRAGTPKKAE